MKRYLRKQSWKGIRVYPFKQDNPTNAVSMLGDRLLRWSSIEPAELRVVPPSEWKININLVISILILSLTLHICIGR